MSQAERIETSLPSRAGEGAGPTGIETQPNANARLPTVDATKPINPDQIIDLTGSFFEIREIRFHSRLPEDQPIPPPRELR